MTDSKVGQSEASRETILVLEDDPTILKTILRVLERAGYKVLGAATPSEALELLRERTLSFSLVITDFSIYAIAGHQIMERLLRDRPELRILFISGHAEVDVLPPEWRRAGSAFLQKPFAMGELVNQVRLLLY